MQPSGPEDRRGGLRQALSGPLPGHAAHRTALPPQVAPPVPPPGCSPVPAAVLLPLHRQADRILFPLIRRPGSMARHAGQIALPGGVLEGGEDPVAGALREASEEVGLPPERVDVLGALTPVFIPLTRYRVHPVVGWVDAAPVYRPRLEEVLEVLLAEPDRLARRGLDARVEHRRDGAVWRFPAYTVEGGRVWGATAQILAEFLEIWRRL